MVREGRLFGHEQWREAWLPAGGSVHTCTPLPLLEQSLEHEEHNAAGALLVHISGPSILSLEAHAIH